MVDYGVRPAIRDDLPRLGELFNLSLEARAAKDRLAAPLGGDWRPHLLRMLAGRHVNLLVVEVDRALEGFALARTQVITGPMVRPPWWSKLMRLPRPRPIVAPYRAVWVDDLHLTPKGVDTGGAPALARAVREWARHLKAHRVGVSLPADHPGGDAFVGELGMGERSRFFVVDLG